MKLYLLLFFSVMTLLGCESTQSLFTQSNPKVINQTKVNSNAQNITVSKQGKTLDQSIRSLSDQLFLLDKFDYKNKTIGVTTFVWVNNFLTKKENNINKFLEYYLPDSLKVEFVQKGGNVIEYQTASSLKITDSATFYLSRDLNELSEDVYINYVLVGSLLESDEGVMVTAEVIDIKTKVIVAGAREYIPTQAFLKNNDVVFKNNQMYRDSTRK